MKIANDTTFTATTNALSNGRAICTLRVKEDGFCWALYEIWANNKVDSRKVAIWPWNRLDRAPITHYSSQSAIPALRYLKARVAEVRENTEGAKAGKLHHVLKGGKLVNPYDKA
jgi:hypothetical protein